MESILDAIGNTPLVRLRRCAPANGAELWLKLEYRNPSGSMKDRMALAMIEGAERDGLLSSGDTVVEYTGGSTGPALALVCRAKGYRALIVIADCFTEERIQLMEALGAELDIIAGADYSDNRVWWWENPYPNFDPHVPRKRHVIKDSGKGQHHDLMVGDFDGDGKPELVFWNQGALKLYLAQFPAHPKDTEPWAYLEIFTAASISEGLAKIDVDGDGLEDIVGGGRWFKHNGDGTFTPHVIDDAQRFTRAAAGQLKKGGWPEVVFVSGDRVGRLKWYEHVNGDWVAHDLLDRQSVKIGGRRSRPADLGLERAHRPAGGRRWAQRPLRIYVGPVTGLAGTGRSGWQRLTRYPHQTVQLGCAARGCVAEQSLSWRKIKSRVQRCQHGRRVAREALSAGYYLSGRTKICVMKYSVSALMTIPTPL